MTYGLFNSSPVEMLEALSLGSSQDWYGRKGKDGKDRAQSWDFEVPNVERELMGIDPMHNWLVVWNIFYFPIYWE